MLKRKLLDACLDACLVALLTLGVGGMATAAPATPTAPAAGTTRYPELVARAAALQARAPQGWAANAALSRAFNDTQWAQLARDAIDPAGYRCSRTPLMRYLDAELADVDPGSLYILAALGAFDLPLYDAEVYGHPSPADRYGINGEQTLALTHEFRDLGRFWDSDNGRIDMVPMHGADVFDSAERTERAVELMYGPGEFSHAVAELLYTVVHADPALHDGAHPVFTFNAVAVPALPELGLHERIVFGDGILQGMAAIGLDGTAARAILGHEFAHHVQLDKGLFASPLAGAEATRRTELMADAFATYYATHSRGLALNAGRVLAAERAFYQVGDCNFASGGHHGTPDQRLRSSAWGAEQAMSAQKQGHVLPALTLDAGFEATLPELVAPDAR